MAIVSTEKAIAILNGAGIAAIPTETVYGLAARVDRESALHEVFATKRRPFFDPLIVHVLDANRARPLTSAWPEIYEFLADRFWPGPLTLIAPKAESVSGLITAGLDTVGLRSPRHPVARQILAGVGVGLAAPSANLFGHTSPTLAAHVESEFGGTVAVVDGGSCEVGVESTVLHAESFEGRWRIRILRPGGVGRGELAQALKSFHSKVEILGRGEIHSPEFSAGAPGQLSAHYQPRNPVVIVGRPIPGDTEARILAAAKAGSTEPVFWFHLPATPTEAARILYTRLRDLSSQRGVIAIVREPMHLGEDWETVWDRLQRAATATVP